MDNDSYGHLPLNTPPPAPPQQLPAAQPPLPAPMPPPAEPQWPVWSSLDEYLWFSCDIIADLLEGRIDQRPLVPARARIQPGDRALAVGHAQRYTWRPVGDGSYTQSSMFAFGGPVFVVGALAANAVGNSVRRNNAARDAQPRWVLDGTGEVTVTLGAAFFGHPTAWLNLHWNGLDTLDLVAPDVVQTSFRNTNGGGSATLQLRTPWASLIFVLAGLSSFTAHPQLLGGYWLPPGFEERCATLGRPCRPAQSLVLAKLTG